MTTTPATPEPQFALGLDLGQAHDPSALAVLRQQRRTPDAEADYLCGHLHRWPLGTPYPRVVDDVAAVVGKLPYCTLGIDGTGAGRAVVDLFKMRPMSAGIRPCLITAGSAATRDEQGYVHLPKVQLVSVTTVLLQAGRLKFSKGLALAKVAQNELANYKVRVTLAGNESFAGDWREGQHDDVCFAVMLAAWVGENAMMGPWTVTPDPGSRSPIDQAPTGVFHSDGAW